MLTFKSLDLCTLDPWGHLNPVVSSVGKTQLWNSVIKKLYQQKKRFLWRKKLLNRVNTFLLVISFETLHFFLFYAKTSSMEEEIDRNLYFSTGFLWYYKSCFIKHQLWIFFCIMTFSIENKIVIMQHTLCMLQVSTLKLWILL